MWFLDGHFVKIGVCPKCNKDVIWKWERPINSPYQVYFSCGTIFDLIKKCECGHNNSYLQTLEIDYV